jgi:hypothetical protein
MAEVKGVQLRATILFLKDRFGDETVEAAINALSTEDRYLLPSVLLDSNWYPYSVWRPVRRISRALSTETGADMAIDMGRFIAEYVFTGVYKSLLAHDAAKLLEKFAWIHDFFYRDTCKIETKIFSKTSGLVQYLYDQGVRPARSTCVSTMGFWIRTLELSGASNVKASHSKCMVDGEDTCVYLIEWH